MLPHCNGLSSVSCADDCNDHTLHMIPSLERGH